jgi:hypothetical protein
MVSVVAPAAPVLLNAEASAACTDRSTSLPP